MYFQKGGVGVWCIGQELSQNRTSYCIVADFAYRKGYQF